jgi:hypothetical protein
MTHRFLPSIGFALTVTVLFTAITVDAQTVISNETLVTTTLVVNSKNVALKCVETGAFSVARPCGAQAPLLTSIPVNCPAAIGATCTFHISLDTTVSLSLICNATFNRCMLGEFDSSESDPSPLYSYQFLVDGAAPVPGPTDDQGDYFFAVYVWSESEIPALQTYPASVVATVTNASSQNHEVNVNLRCRDTLLEGGCAAEAQGATMRVDVFEP